MNLIRLSDLQASDVYDVFSLASAQDVNIGGTVAWSFEGNGIRTRTTFIQAFRDLGMTFIELPNLLKTAERACDLAGYLDSFYNLYVVRESNHARLAEFGAASKRPVINAMSGEGHPCEVLTDAYYIEKSVAPLRQAKVCLWGPPTNVLRSWHELACVLGLSVHHVCAAEFHQSKPNVVFAELPPPSADIVITDGWPAGVEAYPWSLNTDHLAYMGNPALLPTPPFAIGRELAFDPTTYSGFVSYQQKDLLLPVQKAIIRYVLAG